MTVSGEEFFGGYTGFDVRRTVLVDQTSTDLESFTSQLDHNKLAEPIEPASNPQLSQVAHDQRFSDNHSLRTGRVQLAIPHFNYYLVAMASGEVIPCTALGSFGSSNLFGVREVGVIPPNSTVSVHKPRNSAWGYIVGVIPARLTDGNYSFGDWIFQGSGVGVRRLAYYRDLFRQLPNEAGIQDFSDHRPCDQLVFDWGKMTALGGGLHIDPTHLFLRIDESCGLFAYYADQLLRLVGTNLDVWSHQHTEQRRSDEGELTYYVGEGIYPWEILGAFSPDTNPTREIDDEDVLFNKPLGKLEPETPDQLAFYRYEEYGGYLGQGRIRQMCIPPEQLDEEALNKYSSEDMPIGVFREHIALDGSYALQSAKQVILSKRSLIPVPKRKKPQESYCEESDSVENQNYKFSGQYGDAAPEHKVGDLSTEDTQPNLLNAAAVMDLHAYSHNWKALHGFHYHAGDFRLEEESDREFKAQAIPPFEELTYKTWLSAPPWNQSSVSEHRVDDRYGDVRYLEVLSHITLDEYGNVVIQGGAGEEIRFMGGNIQISCPGDIMLQSGRSTVTMAGRDAVVRANKSVDLSANKGDVRVKAERNLEMLSGNSGEGGTLIENRATNATYDFPVEGGEAVEGSGIVMKSANTPVVAMAQSIYLRTGNANGGVQSGDIVLDADSGLADIRTLSGNFYRHLYGMSSDVYSTATGFGQVVNVGSASGMRFGGQVDVDGYVRGTAGATFMSTVVAVTGHFQSASGGVVDRLIDVSRQQNILISDITLRSSADAKDAEKDFDDNLYEPFYADGKVGEPETQQAISFGMRTEEDYGTGNFVLPQTHWQIMADCGGSDVAAWEEAKVLYQGSDRQPTMPWPGYKNWTEDTLLRLPEDQFKFYDMKEGQALDRGEVYEDAELGKFTPAKPQEAYKVLPI